MTTVIIDNKSRTGRRILSDIAKHPRIAQIVDDGTFANIQFEQDWKNAISGNELVGQVHRHIDELYARNGE